MRACVVRAAVPLAIALSLAAPARAQDGDRKALAEAMFEEGLKLMDAGQFAKACPKFQTSYEADPGYGALFNLADCHERAGRTASAWAEFREAVALARKNREPKRAEKAKRRAAALEPKLSKVTLRVKDRPSGLEIRRNGVLVDEGAWGSEIPVDPGSQVIEATAPDKEAWKTTVVVRGRGDVTEIEIPALADGRREKRSRAPEKASSAPEEDAAPAGGGTPRAGDKPANEPPSAPFPTQRVLAVTAGVVGVAGIGVGAFFGLRAKSRWDDARDNHCNDKDQCDPDGIRLTGEAHDAAAIATPAFIAGGVLAAGAIVLWLTAPSRAKGSSATGVTVLPMIGQGEGGVVAGGVF